MKRMKLEGKHSAKACSRPVWDASIGLADLQEHRVTYTHPSMSPPTEHSLSLVRDPRHEAAPCRKNRGPDVQGLL